VTAHWRFVRDWRRDPGLKVSDAAIPEGRPFHYLAGITAGIERLALLQEDHVSPSRSRCARAGVYFKRPGSKTLRPYKQFRRGDGSCGLVAVETGICARLGRAGCGPRRSVPATFQPPIQGRYSTLQRPFAEACGSIKRVGVFPSAIRQSQAWPSPRFPSAECLSRAFERRFKSPEQLPHHFQLP